MTAGNDSSLEASSPSPGPTGEGGRGVRAVRGRGVRASSPAAVLVATLHDPRGVALTLIELDLESVATALETYPLVVIATTAATDARVTTRLEQMGAHV